MHEFKRTWNEHVFAFNSYLHTPYSKLSQAKFCSGNRKYREIDTAAIQRLNNFFFLRALLFALQRNCLIGAKVDLTPSLKLIFCLFPFIRPRL